MLKRSEQSRNIAAMGENEPLTFREMLQLGRKYGGNSPTLTPPVVTAKPKVSSGSLFSLPPLLESKPKSSVLVRLKTAKQLDAEIQSTAENPALPVVSRPPSTEKPATIRREKAQNNLAQGNPGKSLARTVEFASTQQTKETQANVVASLTRQTATVDVNIGTKRPKAAGRNRTEPINLFGLKVQAPFVLEQKESETRIITKSRCTTNISSDATIHDPPETPKPLFVKITANCQLPNQRGRTPSPLKLDDCSSHSSRANSAERGSRNTQTPGLSSR